MSALKRDPIVVERLIAASVDDVFAAWGDADSLSAWMCPSETMSGASVETDFRVGGQYSIVMHGEEGDYAYRGEYLEIDPPKRLVFTWVSSWAPEGERDTRVTISLDTSGDPLHRRGWRLDGGKAPLREDLARAMLVASGWDAATCLVDPLMGSGTH